MKQYTKLTLGLFMACVAFVAQAQPVNYAIKTKSIKAGVLLVRDGSGAIQASGAPHIWTILDRDTQIKPAEWNFDSPLGISVLSTEAANRWGIPASAGSSINKAHAPYWEIDLTTATEQSLSNFDVLQMSVVGNTVITPDEREKLRLFVDKGGILWVDLAVGGTAAFDSINNLPSPVQIVNSGAALSLNVFHPLAAGPNRLNLADLYAMSDASSSLAVIPFDFPGTAVDQLFRGTRQDGLRLDPAALTGTNAVIASTQIGDGFMVVTTRGVSRVINRGVFPPFNNNAFTVGTPNKDQAYFAATKLVMNMLSLSSRFTSHGNGSRNSNSVSTTVSAPALKRFAAPAFPGTKGSPVLFNGRFIVRSGGTLYVYDADPDNDIDRDGNPDDGLPDPVGSPYDRIWSSQDMGTISDPVVIESPGSPIVEQIWVQDGNGRARMFNLSQATFTGVAPDATIDGPPPPGGATVASVFAPTLHEGMLFMTNGFDNGQGRLWSLNPRMAAEGAGNESRNVDDDGNVGGNYWWSVESSSRFRAPGASASIAYIPISDGSGGLDRVAYVGTQGVSSGSGAIAPGMVSIWLGARAEVPLAVNRATSALNIDTRASSSALPVSLVQGDRSPFGLNIRVIRANGQPLTATEMALYFTGVVNQPSNGRIQLQITPGFETGTLDWDGTDTATTADDVTYRIDYTIDATRVLAPNYNGDRFIRAFMYVIDENGSPQLQLMAAPAISDSGNVGLIVGRDNGGSFYNIKESGQGRFLIRTRFEFHSAINNLGALGTNQSYPSSLVDEDDLVRLIPFLNLPMSNIHPVGIAASGDSFYVSAEAGKNAGPFQVPTSALLCFKADPDPIEFTIDIGTNQQNTSVLFKQPDTARSGYAATPTLFSSMPSNMFSIEPIPNSSLARVTMETLASAIIGPLNSCLANNLPVIVNKGGQTDTIYEPEAPSNSGVFFKGNAAGRYNALRWYTVMNGYRVQQGPVVAGGTMFVAGQSVLPSLMNGDFPPTGLDGLMFGMDTALSPDDRHMISTSARPWVTQLFQLKYTPGPGDPVNPPPFSFNNVTPAEPIRWPQAKGITSFDDFRVRILQAALLGENQFGGLAVGEGAVAVVSEDNSTLFKRSDFLVVDAGRISRFDPSGNPIWATESTTYAGFNQPGASERSRKLSTPSRAYPDGANGYVFADPGNNLVSRIDSAGREIRTVESIRFHPDVYATTDPSRPEKSPRGQGLNEAKLLRNPQDVGFWTTYVSAADVDRLFPSENIATGGYRTITNERWDHWLIADAGNSRVIELIDRYALDALGRVTGVVRYRDLADNEGDSLTPALGILWWHSPEEFSGKRYAYNTLARTTVDVGGTAREAVALGFNNVQPSLQTFGLDTSSTPKGDNAGGYGGVVVYDGPLTKVINEFTIPALPNGTLISDLGGGNFSFDPGMGATSEQTVKVSNLTSVSVRYIDTGTGLVLTVMVSTDRGVFELWERPFGTGTRWEVRWMLPTKAYVNMRRSSLTATNFTLAGLGSNAAGFRPMHARRLDSGDVLIVNGYTGTTRIGNTFGGEVILVSGNFANGNPDIRQPGYDINRMNLGFNSLSVQFELPPVQGIRGIVRPIFAERQ
ncbi:MAG: hypothetical protein KF824_07615 [Fimbriimonadaceae bacterium]|nr:MAG: hypothetical protein KF824_07615 [Fimbriimonadaceae bacterium]